MIATVARNKRTEIQRGDNTHTQGQLMLIVSFNTVNIKVRTLIKPIPLFLAFLFFISLPLHPTNKIHSRQGIRRAFSVIL